LYNLKLWDFLNIFANNVPLTMNLLHKSHSFRWYSKESGPQWKRWCVAAFIFHCCFRV